MDRKGANTFPFYKSTSRTEKLSHKEFFCAFVLSMLEKIKYGVDSCFRDISRTSVKQSVPDPPITELATLLGNFISEVYLRIRSPMFSIVCFKICGLVSEFYIS